MVYWRYKQTLAVAIRNFDTLKLNMLQNRLSVYGAVRLQEFTSCSQGSEIKESCIYPFNAYFNLLMLR